MTWLLIILGIFFVSNVLAILAAGWRYRGRHRAEKKYQREYDERNDL